MNTKWLVEVIFCHPRPDRGSISIDSRLRGNDNNVILERSDRISFWDPIPAAFGLRSRMTN